MSGFHFFAQGCAFVDDVFVPAEAARLPIFDWGFLHGDATYDVVHVWNGSFFRYQDHLDRFMRSCDALHLEPPIDRDRIARVLAECVSRSDLKNAYVEMICTRGLPKPGSRDPRDCTNRFYAFAVPFIWVASEEQRERGLKLVVSSVQRIPSASVDPVIKNYHWLDFTRGLFEAYERGGETVVLVDGDGNVSEGPGFNIFAVRDGAIQTPGHGTLEGITRKTVIELCDEIGVTCTSDTISGDALRSAAEVFISSTAGGIMPVTEVDGEPVGDGKPGTITTRLRDLYWSKKESGWHATPVDYRHVPQEQG